MNVKKALGKVWRIVRELGQASKPVFITVPWMPGTTLGITAFPFILFRKGWEKDECLRLHELYHWNQIWQWGNSLKIVSKVAGNVTGIVTWYAAYFAIKFYLKLATKKDSYYEHPFEIPAYDVQVRCREANRPK